MEKLGVVLSKRLSGNKYILNSSRRKCQEVVQTSQVTYFIHFYF